MLKRIVVLFVVAMLMSPMISFSQSDKDDFEKIAEGLAKLHVLMDQLTEQMRTMTPEERENFCKELQEEAIKNPPSIPIQINCN